MSDSAKCPDCEKGFKFHKPGRHLRYGFIDGPCLAVEQAPDDARRDAAVDQMMADMLKEQRAAFDEQVLASLRRSGVKFSIEGGAS